MNVFGDTFMFVVKRPDTGGSWQRLSFSEYDSNVTDSDRVVPVSGQDKWKITGTNNPSQVRILNMIQIRIIC